MAIENLSPRTIVTEPGTPASPVVATASKSVDNSNWEWVVIPEEDLFGEEYTGVSINFEKFGPGRHFVDPEKATEIRRLVDNRLRGDMRVLQPTSDKKMAEIQRKRGQPVPNQTGF